MLRLWQIRCALSWTTLRSQAWCRNTGPAIRCLIRLFERRLQRPRIQCHDIDRAQGCDTCMGDIDDGRGWIHLCIKKLMSHHIIFANADVLIPPRAFVTLYHIVNLLSYLIVFMTDSCVCMNLYRTCTSYCSMNLSQTQSERHMVQYYFILCPCCVHTLHILKPCINHAYIRTLSNI